MKKLFALLLCAAMVLSLAACGKSGGEKVEATPTPEFVYTADFKSVQTSNRWLNTQLFTDEGAYYIISEVVGQREPNEGEVAQWEGQFDLYEDRLYFMDWEGNVTKLENYRPIIKAEESNNGMASSSINTLVQSADGSLISIDNVWKSWSDAPEGVEMYSDEWYGYYNYEEAVYLRVLDSQGNELSCVEMDAGLAEGEYFYAYDAVVSDEGKLIVCSDMYVLTFDPATGKAIERVEMENWAEGFLRLGDGRLCVMNYGQNGYQLTELDQATGQMGENISLPVNVYSSVDGDSKYDLYYTNGSNFFGYDIENEKSEKLFNWLNCGINNDELSAFTVREDGTVLGMLNNWDRNYEKCTTELVTISAKPYDSVPEKKVLTLATQYIDYYVRDMIVDYNRNNAGARIEVLDYSEYNTEDDYMAGLTKLKTEIMAGKVPDIICMNGLNLTQLASKGLLEDLYPWLEQDSELSREDFFPNVLGSMEYNGGLYATTATFDIMTVCGASSVVGDTPGWTYDELLAALATMPEGCEAFDYYTAQDDILSYCLQLDISNFVDWGTGKCSFDSEAFVELLEFAAGFQKEFDWENYEYDPSDDAYNRISQGRQMLMNCYISSWDDLPMYDAIFGGEMTFIGFPSYYGSGSMMSTGSGYAISASSQNKELAWDFVRTFLTEEYQLEQWGFPSNINAFDQKEKEAMTPEYEKDMDGNYLLDENGNKIEVSHGGIGWGDGMMIEIYSTTQEQADKIRELIANTTKVSNYDEDIIGIVREESAAFFEGQKSAQDVAKLIQSKVNIFVNEQR